MSSCRVPIIDKYECKRMDVRKERQTDGIIQSNDKIGGVMEQRVDWPKCGIVLERLHGSMESTATTCELTSEYDWSQLNLSS